MLAARAIRKPSLEAKVLGAKSIGFPWMLNALNKLEAINFNGLYFGSKAALMK